MIEKHIHDYQPSDKEGYEKCTTCGTYHSLEPVEPKILYEDEDYWNGTTRNTPDHQYINMLETETCGTSKVDKVFQHLNRGQSALEIGAFPGALLNKFSEEGYADVIGIEPAEKYTEFIWGKAPRAKLVIGYFPECTKNCVSNWFDSIVAMDIFEHVHDWEAFINEIHRLLRIGGKAVIMSPIIFEDGLYRDRDFLPAEHVHIFTKKFLQPYLENMFFKVEWDKWIIGHEMIILTK